MEIFPEHIGVKNAISKTDLFRKVFQRQFTMSLADELRWEYCKRAMHLLRQRTKCFIGSRRGNVEWEYFVIKDSYDAEYYIDNLNKNIARMRQMQKKAMKAVDEEWYQLDWMDDTEKIGYTKQIE
jgi:hypothetical protein